VVNAALARDAQPDTVLRCHVDDHHFAISVAEVAGVDRAAAVTPLPAAPEGIVGVVDVHGELMPVLSLRVRLGLAPRPMRPSDMFVRVEVDGRPQVLLVDAATAVETVPHDRLRDGEALVPGARYLRDVAGPPPGRWSSTTWRRSCRPDELSQLDEALRELRRRQQDGTDEPSACHRGARRRPSTAHWLRGQPFQSEDLQRVLAALPNYPDAGRG
jgi:purine-binding chemotaxis protein CheW